MFQQPISTNASDAPGSRTTGYPKTLLELLAHRCPPPIEAETFMYTSSSKPCSMSVLCSHLVHGDIRGIIFRGHLQRFPPTVSQRLVCGRYGRWDLLAGDHFGSPSSGSDRLGGCIFVGLGCHGHGIYDELGFGESLAKETGEVVERDLCIFSGMQGFESLVEGRHCGRGDEARRHSDDKYRALEDELCQPTCVTLNFKRQEMML